MSDTGAVRPLPAPRPLGFPHRFRLHRAGIHNVWQYDQVFHFGTGRLLLRGTNGAGKSKALEMLLPFLLDGRTRSIDSTGSGKTTLKWLMLDGYRDSVNRLGYLWVEFHRTDPEGREHLLTLGAAITASQSAKRADAEYFITDIPVGPRLPLHDRTRRPTVRELRETVGEGCHFTQASAYRAEVMRRLFGVQDSGKYHNLLHLLYQLRKPTVGDRVLAGELTKILDESLPPLDDEIIDTVARNLNDLDSVRDELARLEQTTTAVAQFLRDYRRYLHGVLRGRVDDVRGFLGELAQRRRAAGDRQREHAELVEREREAAAEAETVAAQLETARGDLATLVNSSAYQALGDLREKQETVRALHTGAVNTWQGLHRTLTTERGQAERLTEEFTTIAKALVDLRDRQRGLRDAAHHCGIDGTLLGTLPQPVRDTSTAVPSTPLTSPDGERVEIARPRLAALPDGLAGHLRDTAAKLHGVEQIRRNHVRTVADVRSLFQRAEQAWHVARGAEAEADRCEDELARAHERHTEHAAALLEHAERYAEAVRSWAEALPETPSQESRPVVALAAVGAETEGSVADRVPGPETPEQVAEAARLLLAPRLAELDTERDRVGAAGQAAAQRAADLERELAEWQRRADPEPPRPDWAVAPRPEDAGAALYRLVDFADHLDAAERAGLEAALQASGLLSAWLDPAGRLRDSRTRDLLAVPGRPVDGPSLADVLRPVATETVSETAVAGVLRTIALAGTETAAEHWVALDGRWRLGPLRGTHGKQQAEYVGAGVRAETRRRRIADLTARLEEARAAAEAFADQLAAIDERREGLRRALGALPSSRAFVSAWEAHRLTEDDIATAAEKLRTARRRAETTRAEATAAHARARAKASSERLPEEADGLDRLAVALERFQGTLARFVDDVERLAGAVEKFEASRSALAATGETVQHAVDDYTSAFDRLTTEQRKLAVLRDSLGAGEEELRQREAELRRRIGAAEQRLPRLTRHVQDLHDRRIAAEVEHRRATEARAQQEAATVEAAGRLLGPLGSPGLAAAAGITGAADMVDRFDAAQEGPVRDRIAALARLAGEVAAALGPPKSDVSANTLLNRGNELKDRLAGGYDATFRLAHGDIQMWELADDTGTHDIATVGQRLEANLAADRDRVSAREQEVFQRYLLGELGDHLTHQLLQARQAVQRMNRTLQDVRSSHGMGATVEWKLSPGASPDVQLAVALLDETSATRHPDDAARLRDALRRHIETIRRDDPTAGYGVHLRAALDYRTWFEFHPYVLGADGKSRRAFNHRIALSQGEQRVISYLLLFAAAASHFTSLAETAPHAPRLILLDDAFAKVDEPTHARLLGLLIDFDLDFVITSERLWGTFPNVPDLHIYECLRDPARRGVATVHFTWNGRERRLVST